MKSSTRWTLQLLALALVFAVVGQIIRATFDRTVGDVISVTGVLACMLLWIFDRHDN